MKKLIQWLAKVFDANITIETIVEKQVVPSGIVEGDVTIFGDVIVKGNMSIYGSVVADGYISCKEKGIALSSAGQANYE